MIRLTGIALIAALGFFATGLAEDSRKIRIGMSQTIFAGLHPGDAKMTMVQIVEMAGFGEHELEIEVFETEEVFVEAVREGRIDFFPILATEFLDWGRSFDVVPAAAFLKDDADPRSPVVLLSSNPDFKLADLSGKSLIVDESHSFGIGRIWLAAETIEARIGNAFDLCSEVKFVRKPTEAVLPVFFKQKDFCLLNRRDWESLADLNPQLNGLHVVAESEPLIVALLGFRADYDPELRDQFVKDLSHLHETRGGKQVLTIAKTTGVSPFQAEWLINTEKLIERHRRLTKPAEPEDPEPETDGLGAKILQRIDPDELRRERTQ